MADDDTIRVEVVAALPERQELVELDLVAGATVMDAVNASGLADRFPEIAIDPGRLGIFGKLRPPEHELRDGDRVEIYRPLKVDPKEVRRQRARGQTD